MGNREIGLGVTPRVTLSLMHLTMLCRPRKDLQGLNMPPRWKIGSLRKRSDRRKSIELETEKKSTPPLVETE